MTNARPYPEWVGIQLVIVMTWRGLYLKTGWFKCYVQWIIHKERLVRVVLEAEQEAEQRHNSIRLDHHSNSVPAIDGSSGMVPDSQYEQPERITG